MPDAGVDRWPRLELVTFTAPTNIPYGWDAELLRQVVPQSLFGHAFQVANELTLLPTPEDASSFALARVGSLGRCAWTRERERLSKLPVRLREVLTWSVQWSGIQTSSIPV